MDKHIKVAIKTVLSLPGGISLQTNQPPLKVKTAGRKSSRIGKIKVIQNKVD